MNLDGLFNVVQQLSMAMTMSVNYHGRRLAFPSSLVDVRGG